MKTMLPENINENSFQVKAALIDDMVILTFHGKCNERQPAIFLKPYFEKMIGVAFGNKYKIEMDFTNLEYMNSSTITPIVQFLDNIKQKNISLVLKYNKNKFWQESNFSAMKFFESENPPFKILPV